MALDRLTKIDGGGISTTSDYRVGVITATKFAGPFDGTAGNFSGIITASGANFSGNVTIGGTLTYEDVTNIDSVGIITGKGADINGDLDVDGHTNLDNVSIAGVTTFAGAIDADGDIDIDGHTNLDNVNVAGVSTFAGTVNTASIVSTGIDLNGDIDVDGHTNLDNVSVAGVTTFTDDVYFDGATAGRDIVFDRSDNQLEFAPNAKAYFGGSFPLTIYNNINSYISQSPNAALFIESKDTQIYGSGNGYNSPIFIARNGIVELGYEPSGGSLSTQLKTSAKGITVGTGVTIETNGQATYVGIVTATTFVGALTGTVTGTASGNPTLTSGANNRVVTATGANALTGEANLTYDGTNVTTVVSGNSGYKINASGDNAPQIRGDANRGAQNNTLLSLHGDWNGTSVTMIDLQAGPDTTNKDDGQIGFYTRPSGGSMAQRLHINSSGQTIINSSGTESGTNTKLAVVATGSPGSNPSSILNNTVATFRATGATGHAASIAVLAGNTGSSAVHFGDTDNDIIGRILYNHTSSNTDDYMNFYVVGNERLRIDSNGRVKIGSGTPKAQLDIKQVGNSWEDALLIQHDNANTGWNIHAERSGNGLWFGYNSNTAAALADQTASQVLHLNGNRTTSLVTYNDTYELTIGGISGGPTLLLRDSGTSGTPRILFGSTAAASIGVLLYNNSSNHMELHTNGIERFRIETVSNARARFNFGAGNNDFTNPDIGGGTSGVSINKNTLGQIYACTDNADNTAANDYQTVCLNVSRRNTSGDGPHIALDRGGWIKASIAGLQGGNTATSGGGAFAVYTHNYSSGQNVRTEVLRIGSTGVVETGTAINGSGYDSNMVFRVGRAGDCNIAIRNTANTTSHTGLDFGDSGDDRAGRIQYMHNGDYMSFHTNGAGSGSSNERLRLKSNGQTILGNVSNTSGNTNSALHIESGGMNVETGYDTDDTSGDGPHLTLSGQSTRVRMDFGTMNVGPYAGFIQARYDNNPFGNSGTDDGLEPLCLNPRGGVLAYNVHDSTAISNVGGGNISPYGGFVMRAGRANSPNVNNNSTAIKIYPAEVRSTSFMGEQNQGVKYGGIAWHGLDPHNGGWNGYGGHHCWMGASYHSTPGQEFSNWQVQMNSNTAAGSYATNIALQASPQGYVTKPSQPIFLAHKTDGVRITGTGYVTFGQVHINNGSHYDSSNGRFTAPIAGYYFFYTKINAYNRLDMQLRVNGRTTNVDREYGQFATDSDSVGWWSNIVQRHFYLDKNEYVQVYVSSIAQNSDPGAWNTFGGWLVA